MVPGEKPNIFHPHWNADRDQPPFRWRRAQIGRQAGAQALGASVFELPPGAATFQPHAHHANEELIIVLAGRLRLTASDGERELGAGDVVSCPAGRGAHIVLTTAVRDYPPGGEPGGDALDVKLPLR
jgi:uncharacterized cupin superfamily protein